MDDQEPSPAGPNECLQVSQVQGGAAVDDGEALLVTLEIAGRGKVDVVLSHNLGPPLQRLIGILGARAAQKRAGAGVNETRVTAERVARIDMVLAAPDGGVLVQIATLDGYPIAFAVPGALIGELAERLAEQAPLAGPRLRH
jgi:hypothetical protein